MKADGQKILWSGTSGSSPAAPPLSGEAGADLAVIGGGFTGLSAALWAAKAGAKVALVEAETLAHGGSGRNVGLVNAGLWTPPEEIVARLGAEAGGRLNALLAGAPARVFELIETHGIDCEARRRGTLHCAHAPAGMRELAERHRQLAAAGAPVRLLEAAEARARVGTERIHGALLDARAGTIQPHAYALGLARAAQGLGARIFEHSPARALRREGGAWVVETPGGRVRARALLLAMGAYMQGDIAPVRQDFVPVHFAQIATAPLPPEMRAEILPGGEGCWDTALVMSSFRLDRAGRLIVGGIGRLDHAAGRIHASWARRKLAELFPQAADMPVEYQWHGRIAMTADHLPKLVRIGPGALSCLGYSGRGIGPGTVFGEAAARALLSGDTGGLPLAPVAEHREGLVRLRQAFYEAGALLAHLAGARQT